MICLLHMCRLNFPYRALVHKAHGYFPEMAAWFQVCLLSHEMITAPLWPRDWLSKPYSLCLYLHFPSFRRSHSSAPKAELTVHSRFVPLVRRRPPPLSSRMWCRYKGAVYVFLLAEPQMPGCILAVHTFSQPFQAQLIALAHLLWCPFSGNECDIAVHEHDRKQLPVVFFFY